MNAALASSQVSALDTSQVKSISIGAIVAVVVIGLLISFVVTRIVAKIVTLVVVVVLGVVLYSQRANVVDKLDKTAKNCDVTFFGVHVQASNDKVKQACAQVAKQPSK
ncbi:MAG: hypothetical protein JWO63_1065 [Frankiales bacterium]|nr:hypothetical protein [Frankiales bacterium]